MNLIIKECNDDVASAVDSDTFLLDPRYLNLGGATLFLCGNKWDSVYIEDISKVPTNSLSEVLDAKQVYIKEVDILDESIMKNLVDIYPHYAGKIRKGFMSGDSITSILPKECFYE